MAESQNQTKRGRAVRMNGIVTSAKMGKTISVEVFRVTKHSKYEKYFRLSSVFKAHDEENTAKVGDRVLIQETRPLSKTKRWRLIKVLDAAKVQE